MSQHLLNLSNIDASLFYKPVAADFSEVARSSHAPRFLLLYDSLREKSYSRFLTMEAARLLEAMGGEVKIFNPAGLPLPDSEPDTHPKVAELREPRRHYHCSERSCRDIIRSNFDKKAK